jgi:FG-GAP-like repeat/FG-GAP repeat
MGPSGSTTSQVIFGPGTSWFPDIVADFDGDGRSDILWRNATTGDTAIWLMNGVTSKPNGTAIIMSGATGWRVDLARDLDGDQKADLVWRNINTGETAIWLMNGLAPKPNGTAIIFSDPNWTVTHVRDFNGDGKGDLLWRNSVTGATAIWLMNGLTTTNAAVIQSSADWVVAPLDP